MKIGVITFWQSKDNYGQLLQCFAMQRFLQKMGHDAFLIRYQSKPIEEARFKWEHIGKYICRLPTYVSLFLAQMRNKKNERLYANTNINKDRHFDRFLRDNLKCTDLVYTEEMINNDPPIADAYICGSDQIWGGDWAYFLSFAPDSTKKIAYAPSFGGLSMFTADYEEKMIKLLSRFDFLGIREKGGVEVCHRLGFHQAVKVVDPTLLLSVSDYEKIRIKVEKPKKYIFLYLLGNPMACNVSTIFDFANKQGLKVVYVASQGQNDPYEKIYPQIGEWMDYLAEATLVITNSFHCSVFSLIYKRKFITIPLIGGFARMNGRINDLLLSCNLERAKYSKSFDDQYQSNYDFSFFEEYQKRERNKSIEYLHKALS